MDHFSPGGSVPRGQDSYVPIRGAEAQGRAALTMRGVFSFVDAGMWFDARMRFATICLVFLALHLGVDSAMAAGDKKQAAVISFHIETEATDNPKMIFPHEVFGRQRVFRRIPELSTKDFVAFSPFPAEDQASYGVVFQLKENARRRFAAITSISQGKWLVCQAFGRIVDGVMVDQAVDDGAVVVWKGLSLDEIHEMDKTIPRIGENKKN